MHSVGPIEHAPHAPEAREGTLPLVEAFGPTIQGEGPAAGRRSAFLRFGGCNLACSWCDSAYTWDGARYNLHEEIQQRMPSEILAAVPFAPICVITGGEPLLYQDRDAFMGVIRGLRARGQRVHVETNGTIAPSAFLLDQVETFVVSPKLEHARAAKGRTTPDLHPGWRAGAGHPDAHLKFVVVTRDDVGEAARMGEQYEWPADNIWVMPEGPDVGTLQARWRSVCEWATELGLNASHRLHVLAWGEDRGR